MDEVAKEAQCKIGKQTHVKVGKGTYLMINILNSMKYQLLIVHVFLSMLIIVRYCERETITDRPHGIYQNTITNASKI